MTKKATGLSILLLLCAQAAMGMEDVDCFKYYEFQKGVVFKDLMTEKKSYLPGDEVDISYMLMAQGKAPIAQGKVDVQIFYNDSSDGEQLIDEFYAAQDINMMSGDLLKQRTKWTVPKKAKSGTYLVKTYFIVGDFFNLAGVSVLPYGPPGVPGELTSFEVKSQGDASTLYFQKEGTTVNGKPYAFASPPEVYNTGPLVIKTKLANFGPAKKASIKMSAYEWSDLAGEAVKGKTIEKTIDLADNEAEEIIYDISGLPPAAYEVTLSAQSGDEKSIMKLRLPVTGINGRLIYMGLDRFPLKKGESTTAFACFSQSADYGTTFTGTLKLEVLDEEGNQVFQEESGAFDIKATPPQGRASAFTPNKDLNAATLKATLYDADKNVQDSFLLVYDYSKYKSAEGKLIIGIDKRMYRPGDELTYVLTYTDKNGAPLKGRAISYLTGAGGKIISTTPDIEISGQYKGSFKLPDADGTYKITVRETLRDIKAEASITTGSEQQASTTVPEKSDTTTSLPEPVKKTEQPDYVPIVIAGIVLLAIIAVLARRKK